MFEKLLFLLLILASVSLSFGATSQPVQFEKWIQDWYLCGPFPLLASTEPTNDAVHIPGFETDFLKNHGGETGFKFKEGQTERFPGGANRWIQHTAPDSVVNLDLAISKAELQVAYAYCRLESPADQICVLSVGTNDGARIWLNGERIFDCPKARGVKPDDDLLIVQLKKGTNRLLLKVEERGLSWGFCVRVLPLQSTKYRDRFTLFQVETDAAGKASLAFVHQPSLAKFVMSQLRLKLFRTIEPEKPVWETEWTQTPRMLLELPTLQYQKYNLELRGKMIDGQDYLASIPFAGGARKEHVLFEKGKTDYQIALVEDASESEKWAATELQHWLKELSGAEFPIVTATQSDLPQIVVGYRPCVVKFFGCPDVRPEVNDESFTYGNVGPNIYIWGGQARGTMYGVMSFLENELGCRWYTSRVSVIPKKERFVFDFIHRHEAPAIRVRNDFYHEAFEPIWAAHNKINGAMNYREQPGGVESYWSVHTFYPLMPPEEFFKDHPEYYSLIDGKRVWDHAQLCLTNPDVLKIMIERVKQTMRDKPEYLIYSVSQNDWRNPCQCEKCQAIAQAEASESGPVIWFVNQIAEAVEQEFPDKFIGTLAYQYTRKPCKNLRPRENVVIRLCSIECCFAHDFHSCPENASFVADLEGWAAIAPHLYIWDYVVNFSHYIQPYPNFPVLKPNIISFRDNKAIGIMEQAAYQSRGGEFAELRAYVISKLLWNPEQEVEPIINDFMYGYYGRSGQFVRQYFDLLHGRVTPETHIHLGLEPDDKLFSDDFVREAETIFKQAEVVAENEAVRQRVEMAWLPIMYLKCKRMPLEAKADGTYARFQKVVEREGITHYAEAGVPHREAFHHRMDALR